MTDPTIDPTPDAAEAPEAAAPAPAKAELVEPTEAVEPVEEERREAVEEPAKVMRIGSMIKQLLDEIRTAELDEAARGRLRDIYDTSIKELGSALSPDLREELERVAIPFGEGDEPTEAELRIAQAQMVGWLEGLFHGIQATLFAQQMAARNQLDEIRQQLTPGAEGQLQQAGPNAAGLPNDDGTGRPGTYL